MSLYDIIIRPFVQKMDLEKASRVSLQYFRTIGRIPLGRVLNRWTHGNRAYGLQREVFGLQFYNPIGLGAGLDINGILYNDLNNLGFSFVEIGPMGAKEVRKALRHLQNDPQDDILALCIDKDYLTSFTLAYDFFDFFVIDLTSCPDTKYLDALLEARIAEPDYKPIVVKLPDYLAGRELREIIDYSMLNSVDGVELRSLSQVLEVKNISKGRFPIIANCHIDTPQEAEAALESGASLVEIRTGLVREGPKIVKTIQKYLLQKSKLRNEQSKQA